MKKLWMSDFNLRAHLGDARLKVAIVAAMTIFMVVPSFTAMAQEEGEEEFLLEDIVVTGSRIRGGEGVGTSVVGIEREDITMSNGITVAHVIKDLPSVMDLGVTESARSTSGGANNKTMDNTINIHGIGPYATLTLLDGHRLVNNGKSTSASLFPSMGVERIEVVADGASAIYGSDAIAGVVNIIPRRNLNGVDTMFRIGSAADMDPQWQAGAAVGKMWDSGQFMVAYEHVYRESLSSNDRDFATSNGTPWGGTDYRTNESSPGNILVTSGGRRGAPVTVIYCTP